MTATGHARETRHPALRHVTAKAIFVGAVALHLALLVHGGSDPHKRFGFRPFNESDVWTVEIVRLHADGTQWSVNDGTWEYNWDELVGATKMQRLTSLRDAPHPPVHAPRSTFSGDRLIG